MGAVVELLHTAFGSVDDIVLNVGWWRVPDFMTVSHESVVRVRGYLEALEGLLPHGKKGIWATTTPSKAGRGAPPATYRGTGYRWAVEQ